MQLDDMNVQTMWLNHPQGCMGFRLETKEGTFVYATDNEPGDKVFDKNVRKLAAGADVLIYDAQYLARRIRCGTARMGPQSLARSGKYCDGVRSKRAGSVPP